MTQAPPKQSGNSWLKLDDLTENSYSVVMENTTTRTQYGPSANIKLAEIQEKGLVLRVPTQSCSKGHSLHILITRTQTPRNPQRPVQLEITAKVVDEECEERSPFKLVSLQFYQIHEAQWLNFIKNLLDRQKSINNLVKGIQGLD